MARQPKPWYRKSRGLWYVQIDGKQVNLGRDRKAAMQRFHELMAQPRQRSLPAESLAVLFDRFLDWNQRHRAPRTYEYYQEKLQDFLNFATTEYAIRTLTVDGLKPFHVQDWLDSKTCSNGHKRGHVTALKRVFNWAVKMGHTPSNPIAGLEKPPAGRREIVISPEMYGVILESSQDQNWHDLINLAYDTGARPQELLALESRHADLANKRWVFPEGESKGKRRKRIVYLTDTAAAITKRLIEIYPDGHLLRNSKGDPWHRNNISCRFQRITPRLKQKVCLYNFRHTFATRLLEAGVDALVVAALLGHADLSMLGKTYAHLTQNAEHLRNALKKA